MQHLTQWVSRSLVTVTHRKRRVGGWDGDMARYSAMINGCTLAAITGIDRVDKACFGITEYSKLTKKARDFLKIGRG